MSKASGVVNALLEPASKVADLLKFAGIFYSPCTAAGTALQVSGSKQHIFFSVKLTFKQAIVDVESGRRDSDVRIAIVYLEFVSCNRPLPTR